MPVTLSDGTTAFLPSFVKTGTKGQTVTVIQAPGLDGEKGLFNRKIR